MTLAGHVAVSSLIRGSPLASLTAGFLGHWLMDELLDEPKPDLRNRKRLILWLIWQAVVIITVLGITRNWWAILGGVLPDMIDGAKAIFTKGRSWMRGEHAFWFHRPHRSVIELLWLATFGFEVAFLLLAVGRWIA